MDERYRSRGGIAADKRSKIDFAAHIARFKEWNQWVWGRRWKDSVLSQTREGHQSVIPRASWWEFGVAHGRPPVMHQCHPNTRPFSYQPLTHNIFILCLFLARSHLSPQGQSSWTSACGSASDCMYSVPQPTMQPFAHDNTTEKRNKTAFLRLYQWLHGMKAGQQDQKNTGLEIFRNFSALVFVRTKAENMLISKMGEIKQSFDPSCPQNMHIQYNCFFFLTMGDIRNGKLLQ